MREAGSRVFPLFSSCFLLPPPGQVKIFFIIKKIHIGKKASFHLIVETEKNTKTQVIRALKEELQDMAIFDLAFDMT